MDRYWESTGPAESARALHRPTDSERATFLLSSLDPRDGRTEAGAGEVSADTLTASPGVGRLTESDIGNLSGLLDQEMAPNTMRSYRSQWRNFLAWAMRRGVPALWE